MKIRQTFVQWLREFGCDDQGPTAVEYAVMLALITAVCVGSVSVLAQATQDSFNASATAIQTGFAN